MDNKLTPTEQKRALFMGDDDLVEDINAVIGYRATAALMDWFGGTCLFVPESAPVKHHIAHAIGMPAFAKLVQNFGGVGLHIPLDYKRERDRRDRLIGALILKGVPIGSIAKIALMTTRQVHNIRSGLEESGMLPYILTSGLHIRLDEEDVPLKPEEVVERRAMYRRRTHP